MSKKIWKIGAVVIVTSLFVIYGAGQSAARAYPGCCLCGNSTLICSQEASEHDCYLACEPETYSYTLKCNCTPGRGCRASAGQRYYFYLALVMKNA